MARYWERQNDLISREWVIYFLTKCPHFPADALTLSARGTNFKPYNWGWSNEPSFDANQYDSNVLRGGSTLEDVGP